jgi:hypothetical protein
MFASENLLEPFHEILKMTNVQQYCWYPPQRIQNDGKVYDYFLPLCLLFYFKGGEKQPIYVARLTLRVQ